MAEVQSGDNLPKKASGFLRREAALLHQIVEKLSSRNVFQDEVPGEEQIPHDHLYEKNQNDIPRRALTEHPAPRRTPTQIRI